MKNYIANESGGWDTSKALVRRLIDRCVHVGRQHRANGRKEDEYEGERAPSSTYHDLIITTQRIDFSGLSYTHLRIFQPTQTSQNSPWCRWDIETYSSM
jgi:hypothetical protein